MMVAPAASVRAFRLWTWSLLSTIITIQKLCLVNAFATTDRPYVARRSRNNDDHRLVIVVGPRPRPRPRLLAATIDDDDDIIVDSPFDVDYPGRIVATPSFRCGYVSIVGEPNAGKSTLMNALLRETLSVSTHRPQTTRHAILGILTSIKTETQVCFWDTPGTIAEPAYRLQEGMMEAVRGAVRDGDVMLVVVRADDETEPSVENDPVLAAVQRQDSRPVLVAVNKRDVVDDDAVDRVVARWRAFLPRALAIVPCAAADGEEDPGVSVLRALLTGDDGDDGDDLPALFRALGRPRPGTTRDGRPWLTRDDDDVANLIPRGPPLYPLDDLTDRSERFLASEVVRGCLFNVLGKELPYCCEVRVADFVEARRPGEPTRVRADVVVERDSQKGIVIGKGGETIKKVGTDARRRLKEFLGRDKLHLELNVRVDKDWRKRDDKLREFGYLKPKTKK